MRCEKPRPIITQIVGCLPHTPPQHNSGPSNTALFTLGPDQEYTHTAAIIILSGVYVLTRPYNLGPVLLCWYHHGPSHCSSSRTASLTHCIGPVQHLHCMTHSPPTHTQLVNRTTLLPLIPAVPTSSTHTVTLKLAPRTGIYSPLHREERRSGAAWP